MDAKKEEVILKGSCFFYGETGTEGSYWAFQDERLRSYEGLYILKDGDHLTIFSPDNPSQTVWSGVISLKPRKDFSENVFGWRIHATQEGVNKEIWAKYFFKEYPAQLVTDAKNRRS